MPRVVITMPAYEAEGTLERTVNAIPRGIADELILVDDASEDGTARLARDLGMRVHVHPSNRGYGGNQKSCYTLALESGADLVVLLHPDYQYEPKAVPLLIAPILAGDADMTFGSRFAGLGDPRAGGMPLYRYVGNRITTIAQNLLLGTRFTEMHSGMRAYTRECLLSLPFLGYSEGFEFDAALLVDAITSGQRVVEVPIPTRYTKESSSIAIIPSLQYVLAGTFYAARAVMARGRKGKRYLPAQLRMAPSGWATPKPRPLRGRSAGPTGDAPALSAQFCGWMLDEIEAFATGGRRLLDKSGAPPMARAAEQRGWLRPAAWQRVEVLVHTLGTGDLGPIEQRLRDDIALLAPGGLLISILLPREDRAHDRATGLALASLLARSGSKPIAHFDPARPARPEVIISRLMAQ